MGRAIAESTAAKLIRTSAVAPCSKAGPYKRMMNGAQIATGTAIVIAGTDVSRKMRARHLLYFAGSRSARRFDNIGSPMLDIAFEKNVINSSQWKVALNTPASEYPLLFASRTLLHQAAGAKHRLLTSTGNVNCHSMRRSSRPKV